MDVVLQRLADGSLSLASHLDGSSALEVGRLRQLGAGLKADKASYDQYLNVLGNGVGGAALVAELANTSPDPRLAFYEQKEIFDILARVNDPGAADALVAFAQRKPEPYFETRAAHALAQLGDLRAAPLLARRLRLDPLKVYSDERDWEMSIKRDDNERVVSARLLADLATIHPEAHAELVSAAEAALIFWIHDMPSPHANGLRALAAMGSRKDILAFRGWANPRVPLPREGQQPPMPEEWVIAQMAMRYVGMLRDVAARPELLKALQRRPAELDVTMDGLMQGGVAILGMSLRAIGYGAADGLSEWGDPSAFQPLLKYVEDPKNNEQSRFEACAAMAWVGTDRDLRALAQRLALPTPDTKASQLFRACALEALHQRPVAGVAPLLVALLVPTTELELRRGVASALGRNALDAATAAQLARLQSDPQMGEPATLALMLGGSAKTASAALASYQRVPGASLDSLFDAWSRSFGFWSRDDVPNGTLFRYVENAQAMASLKLGNQREQKPLQLLGLQLADVEYDNGPHSVTRPVLRHQLLQAAVGADERRAQRAIQALTLLREVGPLQQLARTPGPRATAARLAHRQAINPTLKRRGNAAQL
jgi:HEAT repeat protein